jgi:hypothetical protein
MLVGPGLGFTELHRSHGGHYSTFQVDARTGEVLSDSESLRKIVENAGQFAERPTVQPENELRPLCRP